MEGEQKKFDALTADEQKNKLRAISKLVDESGLTGITVEIVAQTVGLLRMGLQRNDKVLVIEGKAGRDKAEEINKLKEKIKAELHGIHAGTAPIQIECAYNVGSKYDTITEIASVKTEEETVLEHKQGQVILIDFWATWCPPCQKPMAHNQEMLEKNGATWGDRVRICGISIDKDIPTVQNHIKAKKWETVEHFHRGGSTASEDFGASGVPHVVLVDTHGKIVFIGHPASRDLEKDINDLLEGKTLTGEGTQGGAAGGEEGGEEESKEGYRDLNLDTVFGEMKTYADKVGELKENEAIKESEGKLMRDFVVLVAYIRYCPKTDKFLTKFENINVLVGPQDVIDKTLPHIHSFMEGIGKEFKVVDRVQGM